MSEQVDPSQIILLTLVTALFLGAIMVACGAYVAFGPPAKQTNQVQPESPKEEEHV